MTATKESFLLQFPSFTLLNENKRHFVGNLKVQENVCSVDFFAPNFPSSSNISCKVVRGFDSISLKEFNPEKAKDVVSYIQELIKYLSSTIEKYQPPVTPAVIRDFLDQLRSIAGNDQYKVSMNGKYNLISFTNLKNYDNHYLELERSSRFDVTVRSHSLPDIDSSVAGNSELFSSDGTLVGYLAQFWRLLEQFDEFYGMMNTIDQLCTVVEPVPVTTKHNWRVFQITEKVFAKMVMDPFSPSSIVLNFIGPTAEVEKYRQMYNENIQRWDIDLDVHRNLLRIFDLMYFPMKGESGEDNAADSEEKYCNICYMYLLDGHVPIVSCDNSRCDLVFHAVCLKEWFATLKDGKTFLTVTFGNCPFCKEKLSASFAQLLEL